MNDQKLAPPESDARDFVGELYRLMLGREPDESGMTYFVGEVFEGRKTQADVVRDFMAGEEFTATQFKKYKRVIDELQRQGELTVTFPIDYAPPGESGRCYVRRVKSGFYDRYCSGDLVLDVGFSGYENPERKTALPNAIGIDLDYPGYDGIRLPFGDNSVDTVLSSHCLEHILYDSAAIQDWYRVLKIGGYIVCMVPHQALYEKKRFLPSRWNQDHKRMYTAATLVASFEAALEVNSFRVRHLAENDTGFDYSRGPDVHSDGAYEIELVIEKIKKPTWTLA